VSRSQHLRRGSVVAACALLFASAAVGVARASASSVCARTGATQSTLQVSVGLGQSVSIARDAGGNFVVTASDGIADPSCGGATMTNIDTVAVTDDPSGSESVLLDMANGRFEPGKTHESTGVSEIEFTVALSGSGDGLTVAGTGSGDVLRVGQSAGSTNVNLNNDNDNDADVTLSDPASPRLILNGAGGNDQLLANGASSVGGIVAIPMTLDGGPGNDIINGGSAGDAIIGDAGNDKLFGLGGDDALLGGDDQDQLNGGDGSDVMDGGNGRDNLQEGTTAETGGAGDQVIGGPGGDAVGYGQRTTPVTLVLDGAGCDGELGLGECDNVYPDVETATLGSGSDFFDATAAGTVKNSVTTNAGDDVILLGGGADEVSAGSGDDTIHGGDGNDYLFGGQGIDTEYGDAGNDTMDDGYGPNGSDDLHGGTGIDTAKYFFRPAAVRVTLDDVADDGDIASAEGDNVHSDVENAMLTPGDDLADASAEGAIANQLMGYGGNDALLGGAGDDLLSGDAGDDALDGGLGNDTCTGATDDVSTPPQNCEVVTTRSEGHLRPAGRR
jgi:Ca2+-binding RTX toxin-like protein